MPICDICGKNGILSRALIEGTELNVCADCEKFGKVLERPRQEKGLKHETKHAKETKAEVVEGIVPDFHEIIRKKRESLGLSHEEFAKKINEKVSVVSHMETGKLEPSIMLARKLEHMLKIRLVEKQDQEEVKTQKQTSQGFTIGDMLKVKK